MSIVDVLLTHVSDDHWNLPQPSTFWSYNHLLWSHDSILIFLSLAASVFPLRVLDSDSVASLKLTIQSSKGFFVRKQTLVFNGKHLARNNSTLKDYGVSDGNVLHLLVRLPHLQPITVRTPCGKLLNFRLHRKRDISYVKKQIAKRGHLDGLFDLKDQVLVCGDGDELEDQSLVDDICATNQAVIHLIVRSSVKPPADPVDKDFQKLKVAAQTPLPKSFILESLFDECLLSPSPLMKELLYTTYSGLEKGNKPVMSSEGAGGAYFMQDSSGFKYVSVFKPTDEEPMAVNNPRGLPLSMNGEGLKKGTRVGEGALREIAAYILDHPRCGQRSLPNDEKGFAGVPPTLLVKCQHSAFNFSDNRGMSSEKIKVGSLQMFMDNCGSCEDMGPRAFLVDDVHKITVLDIRLANADRHAGNILVYRDADTGLLKLIPIDHGYCLPENFEDCTFEWLYWAQAHEPYSLETNAYIQSLDADKDIKLLKSYGWKLPKKCTRVLHISTVLLKKGSKRGLTPFDIGSIMCRETLKKVSVIEQIVQEAEEGVLPGTSEAAFLETISAVMDRYLDGLSVC